MEKFLTKKEALELCDRKGFIVMEVTKTYIKVLDRNMKPCKILIEEVDDESNLSSN